MRRLPAASRRRRGAAQRSIQIGGAKRTATVTVYIGKSEDVRTDTSFVELTVGDPEVADVNPLTDRSLSILGKKNGTTRVSVYAEGKKLIGVFDVEVVYDTSLLQHRDPAPLPARQAPGLLGQRPHHAVRHRAGRPDGRQGGDDRQAVRPGRDQFGRGDCAAAGHAGGALRRSHRARPAAISACSGTCSASTTLANIGNRTPSDQLPVTNSNPVATAGSSSRARPSAARTSRASALGISPVVVAGVLSGTAPFGVMVGKHARGRRRDRRHHQCAGAEGRRPLAGRAEPRGAVGRHRELPRRRRISDPGARRARHGHDRLQALRRRPRLHADRAERRPDQPEDRAGGQPARHQPSGDGRRASRCRR